MKRNKCDIIIELLVRHIKSNKNLYKTFDYSNAHQKYSICDYLKEILYVLKTGISWRDIRSPINWNSIYKTYAKLNKYNIFQISYIDLFKKYIEKYPNKKLRFVMTDTTFIPNKKGKNLIGYNKYYNRKNGTKLSLITDAMGNSFNVKCYKGNKSDSRILIDQLKNDNLVSLDNVDVYKEYFLADPAYDSKEIRSKLKNMHYKPVIAQNKRNIKDPNKLISLSKYEKRIYSKRLTIENAFNKLKVNRKLCLRYESNIDNFIGFIYLALIKIMC